MPDDEQEEGNRNPIPDEEGGNQNPVPYGQELNQILELEKDDFHPEISFNAEPWRTKIIKLSNLAMSELIPLAITGDMYWQRMEGN